MNTHSSSSSQNPQSSYSIPWPSSVFPSSYVSTTQPLQIETQEMGSLIPFQELNLIPYPFTANTSTTFPATATTSITNIIPKSEPILERLYESLPPPPLPHTLDFSMPNLSFSSNPDLAIVPMSEENQIPLNVLPPQWNHTHSSELNIFTNSGIMNSREKVRKTRMVYESVRVWIMYEEEKRSETGQKRIQANLKSASMMKDRGMWLNRGQRVVGSIPGIEIGDVFFFRMELCVVGLHGQTQAGIDYHPISQSATSDPIATSIIVSGGYEDDVDAGNEIIYTGHGGQDKHLKQCAHQKLKGGNLALVKSMYGDIPLRVIRGLKHEGSPSGKVYIYDGLYRILSSWLDVGRSGFSIFKYKLVRMENQPEMGSAILRSATSLTTLLSVRPLGYVSLDLSNQIEKVPILLYNNIDDYCDPMSYQYLVSSALPPFIYQRGSISGCDCVFECKDNCSCAMKNGGDFAYDHNGILVRGKPLIFECGSSCRCPPSCHNRVSQKGVKHRYEVFRWTKGIGSMITGGWGVRSLDLIKAGSFISEYAGVVLTREQAEIFAMNGDSGLIFPNRFSERWAEWGDLSEVYPDYVRPSCPSIPPLDFALDISKMRNVASYISHNSSPNVFVQFVLHDHGDIMFPRLMLFAMENIPPMRELSLDYGWQRYGFFTGTRSKQLLLGSGSNSL